LSLNAAPPGAYRAVAMNAPGVDAFHVVETLRAELPAAIDTGAMPGAAGWALRDVRTERLFDRAVVTLTFTREGQSVRTHLFPTYALADPAARIRHFDLYHRDDLLEGHAPRAQALLAGLLSWLDQRFAEASEVSLLDPSAPATPAPPPEIAAVIAGLTEKLPALLASEGLAGWSLTRIGIERFQFLYVPRVDLARGGDALHLYLLPRGTEEKCHFHTARFDMVYDEDARGSTYTRHHAAMEQIVSWLEATFPAAPTPAAPLPDASPRSPAEALCREIDARLSAALRSESLPALAGWSWEGAAVERFRDEEVPTIRVAREGRSLALRVLPTGAEPTAILRTERFDLAYDDDARGTGFTRDHTALEAIARWLGEAFPAEGATGRRERPRVRRAAVSDEATQRAEAEAASIHEALSRAIAAGDLPELDTWAFDGVALESFRDQDVPTAHLSLGDALLKVRIMPAQAESSAYFRTDRFDLLYDEDGGAPFARHHALLEGLTRCLAAAFPLGESEHARDLARRRALRAQQIQAPADLVALAESIEARLREAVAAGALALPEGWRFEGVGVDQQQGVTAPAARFLHGERAFVLRVLPTAPERAAFLRTPRFDVLYDSEPGDWQLQDEPVARGFVAWLDAAFPAEPTAPEPTAP